GAARALRSANHRIQRDPSSVGLCPTPSPTRGEGLRRAVERRVRPLPKRPNIVFVLTDDQGYPPLGAHGHPLIQTPHLDRFHAEAVRFEQFHSGTTCAPTRAGLLTGHYCNSTGVWHTVGGRSLLRADEWTLADALGEAGWRTGI